MRKLFLASMLTLGMAGAAFANNDKTVITSEVITPKIEVIQIQQTVQKETKKVKCFSFNSSCGGSESICHAGVSAAELIWAMWMHDAAIC